MNLSWTVHHYAKRLESMMQSVQHLEQCACMLYKSRKHSTLWWNSMSFMLCGPVNKPLFNIVKQNIKCFDAAKFERFFLNI